MDLGRPSGSAGYNMLLASGPQRPMDHCFKLRTKLLGAVMDRLGRPNGCVERRHGPAVADLESRWAVRGAEWHNYASGEPLFVQLIS